MSLAAASGSAARAGILAPGRAQLVVDLVRYAASSAAALALDYGLLLTLSRGLGVHYLLASAVGFLSGLALAYALSVTFVFRGRRTLAASSEFAGFAAIGAAGLALTQLSLLCLVGGLGVPIALAKPVTALAVFVFNFGLRRAMLFAPSASANAAPCRP